MIDISSSVRDRVSDQYDMLCQQAGTRKAGSVLQQLSADLPYTVEISYKPAEQIHSCSVTGQASTDADRGVHHIEIATELRGSVKTHTLAHELYHLAHHRPECSNVEAMLDYYLTMPEFASLPRDIARTSLLDALDQPLQRDGQASVWEQEAECFALLVVSNSSLIARPLARTALVSALGDVRAR